MNHFLHVFFDWGWMYLLLGFILGLLGKIGAVIVAEILD